ncbi:MAG: TauD/TfdA family dioxygenase [Gammaproteobacteria bacterium]|nr:TauD/TfdA family dioxygenase [Gammaproteobacteria bacterium]
MDQSTASGIIVSKLDAPLGARITGFDMRRPVSRAQFEDIHAAWMAHLVLVFPGQPVSDEEHVVFSRNFGTLEVHHQDIIRSDRMPEIFRVSNVDENGELMTTANPVMRQIDQARRWHTDSSFRENPSMGSLLHGIEVTRTGGETCFIDMYAVYQALPENLRESIQDRRARHDFELLHRHAALRPLTPDERAAMPPVWQPMVRRHPVTGRESLYISPIYNDAIEGMADDEAAALIDELTRFASQDRFVYRHRWQAHDLVLWDNRCTMHLVAPYDRGERRVMHRTTIAGEGAVLAAGAA